MATTAAPYGFWATNPTKKLAYWVYLLGQPLSRNRVFQNFSGEPPLNKITSGIFSEIYSVLNLKIVKFELNVQQKLNSKNDVHKLLIVLF